MPRPYILLIHNKMCDFLSVLFLSKFQEDLANTIGSYYDLTIDFVYEVAKLCTIYGSKFFNISKSLEGLCVAETLLDVEKWNIDDFWKVLIQDLFENKHFDYPGSKLRFLLTAVDIPMRHELSCLSKLIGHPLVDILEGVKNIHQKTTEVLDINRELLSKTIDHAKLSYVYVSYYIIKYKRWPKVIINSHLAPKA